MYIELEKDISWQIYDNKAYIIKEKLEKSYTFEGLGLEYWKSIVVLKNYQTIIQKLNDSHPEYEFEVLKNNFDNFLQSLMKFNLVFIK